MQNTKISEDASVGGAVLPYMVQLDGLRAFAVLTVLLSHYIPEKHRIMQMVQGGQLGVQLFFVLSGFLITGILLKYREASPDKSSYLKQFYARRFLRIFPLYYFVLFVVFLFNINSVRESIWWYLLYSSNIKMSIEGHWDGALSHFWSLAVEEQFYLFWPLIILFLPRKLLLPAVFTTVLIGPLSRQVLVSLGANGIATQILMPTNLDSLGMGALLALFEKGRYGANLLQENDYSRRLNVLGIIGLASTLALLFAYNLNLITGLFPVFFRLTLALFYLWLVFKSSHGFGGITGRILSAKTITYLGKISYGIYIYHNLIPPYIYKTLGSFAIPSPYKGILQILLSALATVFIAMLSWHLFESPINHLKKYFSDAGSERTKELPLAATN